MEDELQKFTERLVDRCADFLEENDPLYDIKGFAKLCGGVSPFTVESWLWKGKIRRTKIGSRTMIRASELRRIMQEGGKSRSPKQKADTAQ